MKIGIISMQRVINYGSYLQSYALKRVLEQLGNECFFIDIKPGRKIVDDSFMKRENRLSFLLKRLDRHLLKRIKHLFFCKSRKNRFQNEFFPILGLSKDLEYYSNYDTIIIGSDEVFNCIQESPWGFAKTLFGEELDSKNIITYAASCGHTTLEKLEQYGLRQEVKDAMSNLSCISVRDLNTKEFAKEMTNKNIYEHLDPTLIFDFDNMVPQYIPETEYILIYSYDGRLNERSIINELRDLSKQEDLKIISAGFYQHWCEKNILCTPFELLGYFKYAKYIVTDTFHGTIFSIKYNKQFVTVVRDSNKHKLRYLLEKFYLAEQEFNEKKSITQILKQEINYVNIKRLIEEETINTIVYLKTNIKKT